MRNFETKRAYRSSNVPVYDFDTDATLERVIRDPMAVLLGRSSLAMHAESVSSDPYNRVGRWAKTARK